MSKKLIIGSRDSKLALIQSYWVRDQLKTYHPDLEVEIKEIKTIGDKILDTALAKIGDKGLFVKELENELLANSIDLAVHSMKDLPTRLPEGLEISTTSKREDIRDVLCLSKKALNEGIKDLSEARVIATSSLRRVAQLKRKYPQIKFVDIRGNLNTRFKKLDESDELDGIILAAAGIKRLAETSHDQLRADDLDKRISQYLEPGEILPAVGQGALGIEISSSRDDVKELLRPLNSFNDEMIVKGERAFLRELEGGCQVPIGIYSELNGKEVKYTGVIASLDGSEYLREEVIGTIHTTEELGKVLAAKLMNMGAKRILDELKEAAANN